MTNAPSDKFVSTIDEYYSDKIRTYGATPQGVDWNGEASQRLRYEQIARVLPASTFSVCDLGCGYGAFYDYLVEERADFRYLGVDVSAEMVREAERLHQKDNCRFIRADRPDSNVDFVVASGIFNVRPGISDAEWRPFVFEGIDRMNAMSTRGFAFNCLTSHSDSERMRDYLFYADPSEMLVRCLGLSRRVALLHDYGLYEFTVIVHKETKV
ncbi:MAG: methyltransferase [Luteimonas sp.]